MEKATNLHSLLFYFLFTLKGLTEVLPIFHIFAIFIQIRLNKFVSLFLLTIYLIVKHTVIYLLQFLYCSIASIAYVPSLNITITISIQIYQRILKLLPI